jgi:hypothetical protein
MITDTLPFRLGTQQHSAEMEYNESDPYVVTFIFRQRCAEADCTDIHEVAWVISRDLLTEGIDSESWVGVGDIRVRRDSHVGVEVYLTSHEGVVTVQVPRSRLRAFLKRTATVVDYGKESDQIDWEEFDKERVTWS